MKDYIQRTFETAGEACQYICGTIQSMQKHCREEHGWKNKNKGGRPKKRSKTNQEVPWRTGVHCQRFFKQGPKSGYLEVGNAEATPQANEQAGIASRTDQFKAAKRELEAALRKAEEEERRVIKEAHEAREPNPWLRRVGWAAHLAGLIGQNCGSGFRCPMRRSPIWRYFRVFSKVWAVG
jgi:hypothetical protein